MDGEKKKARFFLGYLILAFWAVLLIQQLFTAYTQPGRISYSEFKSAVQANKVEEVSIGQTTIRGRFKPEAPAATAAAPGATPPAAQPPAQTQPQTRPAVQGKGDQAPSGR